DLISCLAVILRGLAASLCVAAGPLLLSAALTIICNPSYADLSNPNFLGIPISQLGLPAWAGLITFFLLIDIVFFIVWSIVKSLRDRSHGNIRSEDTGIFPSLAGLLIVLTLAAAFIGLQPRIVAAMFKLAKLADGDGGGVILALSM